MSTYTYPGLTKDQKEALFANMAANVGFPEVRGQHPKFTIVDKDGHNAAEKKKKLQAEYRSTREKEIKADIEKLDAAKNVAGFEFKKGVALEIKEPGPKDRKGLAAYAKIQNLVESGTLIKGKAETEKKGPGRPKKED